MLVLLVGAGACSGGGDGADGIPASFEIPSRGPAALATLRATEVVGRTGPEGHAFSVQLRTPDIEQYPCTSCHNEAVSMGGRGEEVHANIQPTHPSALAATCETCHTATNPELLTLQTGEAASLDEAYRLCVQCHFTQGDAWAGGAHGKRLVGWRGERVVMNCTGCHNPHEPAFEQRIPFPGPRIPRTRRPER